MNQQIQPGTHLDPDQMIVFVEGVATAREREQVLAHLARCPECRDAVFLLQASEVEARAQVPAPARPQRLRWFMPIGLASAALAAGITMLVLLRPHQPAPVELHQQQASVEQPASTAPPPAPRPKPLAPGSAEHPKAAPPRPNLPAPLPATGANVGQLRTEQNTALAGSAPPGRPAAARSTAPEPGAAPAAPIRAVAAPPPATAPVPPLLAAEKPQPSAAGAAADKDLPLTDRSMATLGRPGNLPALRIEHDRGPDDGSSRVNGRVMDASGAVISGATVTLRDSAGATRQATTASDGAFDIPAVPPGHYELLISALGFETSKQAVDLEPRDLAMLDSALRLGASTQTVTVEAEAPTLNTSTAEVSAVVRDLPSHLPPTSTVTSGRRTLSLDSAGTLFLSRNGGRSWKKIKPSWPGKVTEIELESAAAPDAGAAAKKSKVTASSLPSVVFQITTESGAHWISSDGSHWLAR